MAQREYSYVICHMLQSIDGKIAGNMFQYPASQSLSSIYGKMSKEYMADAIVYGSTTGNEIFTKDYQLDLSCFSKQGIDKNDFICMNGKTKWIVIIDPMGTLGWNKENLKHERLEDKNIIEVVCERVSQDYLAYLKKLGISYIFAGKESLNMKTVLKKLKNKFHISMVLLQGGGIVNQSFVSEGLIDELSFIISPVSDGQSNLTASFESRMDKQTLVKNSSFHLVNVEKLPHSGLWLNYKKE